MKCINASSTISQTATAGSTFRYTSRSNTEGNRDLMMMWWNEMNSLYGMGVHYYVHGYTLTGHDFIYGEEPTAAFSGPAPMILLGIMESDSLLLSKWGIQTNADFTAIIPRPVYAAVFGGTAEPKSGDLIRLVEWGCDRPGACGDPYYLPGISAASAYPVTQDQICESIFSESTLVSSGSSVVSPSGFNCAAPYCDRLNWGTVIRCPYLFEVTERRDEMITQGGYNTFMGHYVWILHCKRFDYSYEPGIGPECGNQQVSDEKDTIGIQISGSQSPSPDKKYSQNIEDESNEKVWDYDKAPGNNTDVYGGY